MWRCRLALLNWVMTKIRSIPACRLLLMGMSIRRNLPPIGTAGLARSRVRGHSRLPWPPPRIAVITFSIELSPPSRPRQVRRILQQYNAADVADTEPRPPTAALELSRPYPLRGGGRAAALRARRAALGGRSGALTSSGAPGRVHPGLQRGGDGCARRSRMAGRP